ncbi:MAG TPA: hypothetical protein IAB27_03830 [Candidatus Coprosoma intestinipullorum]|uniref:Uncharacterized protein n=1 Tax=Candidatus Coprosoma intestinipullorum TaxID=2840752 RepID=A0A9D0ZR68_9FIRM|nr:hypothetical protein [Candidatus Coprosoma intestinipullorum]
MDKAIRWLSNYWAYIALIIMVLGAAYLGALDEKKTAELGIQNGQTINELNK